MEKRWYLLIVLGLVEIYGCYVLLFGNNDVIGYIGVVIKCGIVWFVFLVFFIYVSVVWIIKFI